MRLTQDQHRRMCETQKQAPLRIIPIPLSHALCPSPGCVIPDPAYLGEGLFNFNCSTDIISIGGGSINTPHNTTCSLNSPDALRPALTLYLPLVLSTHTRDTTPHSLSTHSQAYQPPPHSAPLQVAPFPTLPTLARASSTSTAPRT